MWRRLSPAQSLTVRAAQAANTVLHYGKDGALTGPDKEHAETAMLALHLLQSSLNAGRR
ncbi:hypothetical protein SAMN05216215_100685 [Saccharopolyspora shandongensis]|uniref:Uncharacterized protein n=1 Tax=Saccharopolyspora shandongensis TaxID=418495 RepID=A0A1H2XHC6_9PSEU|nr:hypothetical protein [Saccharopolyspora shandongensis]SDW92231.1 hypothetical protein SAMN05216215_100685 [Saccharopolyspora shandongensis]